MVGVGDSITAGAPGWDPNPALRDQLDAHDPQSQWEYWAQAGLGDDYYVRNCGVPGDLTDEIAARLDGCLAGADIAVIQGGVNDLANRRTVASAARNLREMVRQAKAAGVTVVLANLLPVNKPAFAFVVPKLTRLNRLIEQIAREEGAGLVDFFDELEGPPGSNRMPKRWTADTVHPSVEGYSRLGRAVAQQLRQ